MIVPARSVIQMGSWLSVSVLRTPPPSDRTNFQPPRSSPVSVTTNSNQSPPFPRIRPNVLSPASPPLTSEDSSPPFNQLESATALYSLRIRPSARAGAASQKLSSAVPARAIRPGSTAGEMPVRGGRDMLWISSCRKDWKDISRVYQDDRITPWRGCQRVSGPGATPAVHWRPRGALAATEIHRLFARLLISPRRSVRGTHLAPCRFVA